MLSPVSFTGCATPADTVGLNQVIRKELRGDRGARYPYRCTMGAHRGASTQYRENTLDALFAAEQDTRYAFIEFDVQYAGDNTIVLYHDQRLVRQYGSLMAVGTLSLEQLTQLTDQEIVTYQAAMSIISKKLNIEIKSQGDDAEDRRLADELIADLKERGREHDTMISSISPEVIRYIKQQYPEIKTGQIFWLTLSTFVHADGVTEQLFRRFNESMADYLMLHVANLRNLEKLLRLKPKDKTIVFWDFDDSMYLVHKDASDRLWGDSAATEWRKRMRYKMSGK